MEISDSEGLAPHNLAGAVVARGHQGQAADIQLGKHVATTALVAAVGGGGQIILLLLCDAGRRQRQLHVVAELRTPADLAVKARRSLRGGSPPSSPARSMN